MILTEDEWDLIKSALVASVDVWTDAAKDLRSTGVEDDKRAAMFVVDMVDRAEALLEKFNGAGTDKTIQTSA